jgi:hypothetical protein
MRPFRNKTHYVVTVAIGNQILSRLGPCFVSMITVPVGELTITARAAVLEGAGQHEIPLDVVVNPAGTGWDVVNRERTDTLKTLATRAQPR